MSEAYDRFLQARDFLLQHREDYAAAVRDFTWPEIESFNWALDHFDHLGRTVDRTALWIVDEDGSSTKFTFAQMSERSNRVANFLRGRGVQRGDRVLLMLANVPALWEVMLACMKLGAVMIPTSTLMTPQELEDRRSRGRVAHVITHSDLTQRFSDLRGDFTRIAVGPAVPGWIDYADAQQGTAEFTPDAPTKRDDLLLLYFTSGTTAKAKLVAHTHQSYPVGHLSTMYWLGLRPGDVHLNISSPGWAKHAWSNVFTPWIAESTVFVYTYERFDANQALRCVAENGVTSLCAPPTVWRLFIQQRLADYPVKLREALSAGEPLNPEVIEQVRAAWGITIRDGYGQTETTAQVGNPPRSPLKEGAMGRPMPGYQLALLDPQGAEADEGELSIRLDPRPLGLMQGYEDDPERTAQIMAGGFYRTGDVVSRDADGYLTYVGRADDVFKASDYRISPFELESVLIEHPAVAEAAVVPSPDPMKLAVPKAFVILAAGHAPSRATAESIFEHCREQLAPFKRVRRLQFSGLPKTISGKIRRVELGEAEAQRRATKPQGRDEGEYWEEDLKE